MKDDKVDHFFQLPALLPFSDSEEKRLNKMLIELDLNSKQKEVFLILFWGTHLKNMLLEQSKAAEEAFDDKDLSKAYRIMQWTLPGGERKKTYSPFKMMVLYHLFAKTGISDARIYDKIRNNYFKRKISLSVDTIRKAVEKYKVKVIEVDQ